VRISDLGLRIVESREFRSQNSESRSERRNIGMMEGWNNGKTIAYTSEHIVRIVEFVKLHLSRPHN
jgi:hypothetical protein